MSQPFPRHFGWTHLPPLLCFKMRTYRSNLEQGLPNSLQPTSGPLELQICIHNKIIQLRFKAWRFYSLNTITRCKYGILFCIITFLFSIISCWLPKKIKIKLINSLVHLGNWFFSGSLKCGPRKRVGSAMTNKINRQSDLRKKPIHSKPLYTLMHSPLGTESVRWHCRDLHCFINILVIS